MKRLTPTTCVLQQVQSELTLDDAEITFEEMAMAFQEVVKKYDSLRVEHLKLKKKNSTLTSKLDIILTEKEDLTISHNKIKKNFDSHMNTTQRTQRSLLITKK